MVGDIRSDPFPTRQACPPRLRPAGGPAKPEPHFEPVPKLAAWLLVVVAFAAPALAAADPPPDRRWADDLPAYVDAHPRQRWVVGTSPRPELTEAEATDAAEADAADRLAAAADPADPAGLRPAFAAALAADPAWVVDRRAVARPRPYATVWGAKVLVAADPARVAAVVARCRAAASARRTVAAVAIASAVGWVAALAAAFAAADALTRGYLRGRLAAAAVAVAAVGLAGIGYVAGLV